MNRKWVFLFIAFIHCAVGSPARILVGAPIRQKPTILKEFLSSLERQDCNGYSLDYYFVDDNDDFASKEQLTHFAKKYSCLIIHPSQEGRSAYICNEKTHVWKEDLIWRVASFKNQMLAYAKEQGYDYLFLVDSDIVLHPKTIRTLIDADKEIVSNVFWTAWNSNESELPQVWLTDTYTQFEKRSEETLTKEEVLKRHRAFIEKMRKPGLYEVGGLGACTLIRRSAIDKGVNFNRIKNITFWGEDRHFCVRAAALGISLFVDTHFPAYHIYREHYLAGVGEFVKNAR